MGRGESIVKPTFGGRCFGCSDWGDMTSHMESSKRIQNDFAESPSTAGQTEKVIGLLAFGLSFGLGIILGLVTQEFVIGVACAVGVFEVVVFGGSWFAETLEENPYRTEAQVRKERPEQQSSLRGDAAKSIEPRIADGEVTVRRAPKKPDEALVEHERETKLQPGNPEALCDKGTALFELRGHQEALQTFDKAIRLKPDCQEAWYDKGLCLLELERPDEGAVAFKEVIRLSGRI